MNLKVLTICLILAIGAATCAEARRFQNRGCRRVYIHGHPECLGNRIGYQHDDKEHDSDHEHRDHIQGSAKICAEVDFERQRGGA